MAPHPRHTRRTRRTHRNRQRPPSMPESPERTIVLTGKPLPAKAGRVLCEILHQAGLASAKVTSTTRSFEEQARVMVDYYLRHGAESTRTLYGSGPGGKAIAHYEAARGRLPPDALIEQMAALMREAIAKERAAGAQRHLMHTSETHCVFDVAPSSISAPEAFVRAACEHPEVSRFLHPGSDPPDPVFHIEVPHDGET